MENINKKKIKNYTYILYFLIYAFIGWLLETFYSFAVLGHFTKRGFLFGPLCPIYGWGAVILLLILQRYKSNSIKLFFASALVFSIFEYLVGYGLDALFSAKWWDYTNDFMNLNGRISIFYSFAWGIIAILFLNHIHPFIEKKVKKLLKNVPNIYQAIAIKVLIIILIIDTILSSINHLGMLK